MNCKNCNSKIIENDNYCGKCGAKIIKERITLKNLFYNFVKALGWDNKFFITLRFLLYKPHKVCSEFIYGIRKYATPFTFFAINLTISLFVFNMFSDEFIDFSSDPSVYQTEQHENNSFFNEKSQKGYELLGYKNQIELQKSINSTLLKYSNIISFVFLPFYTLLAFLVFGKPYNFGEHLVINTYIQGILMFWNIILFLLSLLTKINFFIIGSLILVFLYYTFTYQKIYNLTLGKLSIKFLKLIGILIIFFLIINVFVIAVVVLGIVAKQV